LDKHLIDVILNMLNFVYWFDQD